MFISKEKYKACIYTRLSKDDGDKPESDSIGNQKALIRDFIRNHPEIQVVSEKADDGYSGVNFERPGFKEMMDEIRAGQVDCVIVKDLSRFGRNYIEAGNYIERVFPFIGVRFIAINDSYDSKDQNQSNSLIIPFKNLINDAYCKDISVKIRTQLDIKRKKGEFIGAFAVYGYLKDPEDHNKLVVDTFASEVVRAIFRWKLEGLSQGDIAERLNAQGVLCPMEYKLSLGMKVQTNFRANRKAVWSWSSVSRILIVSKELFDKVQDIFEENKKVVREKYEANAVNREGIVNRFKGKIICGDCGKNMRYSRNQPKKRQEMYGTYTCGGYIDSHRTACSLHYIYASDVEAAVYTVIQEQLKQAADMEEVMERLKDGSGERNRLEVFNTRISNIMQEITKTNTRRQGLYENFVSGMLDESEYQYAKKEYDDRIGKLNRELDEARKEKEQFESVFSKDNRWLQGIHMADDAQELTDDMIGRLVEVVKIYEDCRVEVVLNYSDDRDRLATLLKEMEADHGNC